MIKGKVTPKRKAKRQQVVLQKRMAGTKKWKAERRASAATYTDQNITIDAKGLGGGFIGALWNDHGFIDFNLNRECIRLKARFGQDDRADDTAVAGISVVADGTSLFSGSFKLTESVEQTLSLDKAFRVGFHWTSTNPDKEDGSGSSAAIVAPEVLCSN